MKRCSKCNILIETNQKYCPLCHQVLKGEVEADFVETYPEYVSVNKTILPTTKKLLFLITFLSILILGIINLRDSSGNYWSLIPIGGIIYFWVLVRVGIFSKRNIAFKLGLLTVLLILLLIYVDYSSYPDNNGWSINYLMPLLLLSANLAISFIVWLKTLNYRDYFFYLLLIVFFSLIPLILAFFNVVTVLWPSLTAFSFAIFILLLIILFFPKSVKDEFNKRFHA